MLAPIVCHMSLNTGVLPVKCTPARSACASATSLIAAASPGTKLITPRRQARLFEHLEHDSAPRASRVDAGFQTTVLPMSAGAVGRLPAMEVKLNGVTA